MKWEGISRGWESMSMVLTSVGLFLSEMCERKANAPDVRASCAETLAEISKSTLNAEYMSDCYEIIKLFDFADPDPAVQLRQSDE